MKWLILSDNHGNWAKVNDIINKLRSQVDLVIHCGDSEFDADDPIWENVDMVVAGNMDFDAKYPRFSTLDTPVGKILVTHGHLYRINYSKAELQSLAEQQGADFIFHGHTHVLYAEQAEQLFWLNPGSLNHSRGMIPYKTYAIVEVTTDKVTVQFYKDDMTALPELCKQFVR